ncbi:MAG: FAD-dependent oxidoreductase [Syntrophales bacterium]|jgi:electron transfer flavoprotein-quinone oxidoreductase|nr:FAD-dependent oxidoreductase [Syntrophales bacterium]MCK9528383.1 FAD-dependent oxidoreductase [Syntrophales bacterium]MDX9922692.1 FAD-dependent oxidoreductase [Syntrophales bacterium]
MEQFDVIIAGAGLAGLAAASTLASEGLEVLILERGDYPGAKNVTGGRIYVNPLRGLFPDLFDSAPLERPVVSESSVLMARERSVTLSYSGDELRAEPYQSHSILRAKFDRWLAERAEAKGAMLMTKARVDDLIQERGAVVGVRVGEEELRAPVVIACDGVLSLIAEKAGLRKPASHHHYALGIKEVIGLDPGVINDRFNLEGNEGAARLFVGEATGGLFGGGFLYTNRESLSLGIVVGMKSFLESGSSPDAPELFELFRNRPEIRPLIQGGTPLEYAAHVISEGGYRALGPFHGPGILLAGDAAGLTLNMGVTVRGMEYALASGSCAARAVLRARETGDFGSDGLSVYTALLEDSFVLKDFKAFQETSTVLNNPRFFRHYPELVGAILADIYRVPAGPKERLFPTVRKRLTTRELLHQAKDLWEVRKI